MFVLKQQIAASLEDVFSQFGFAEPSVSQLQKACDVSLRTLYKHFPSKEEMIVAALDYRHQRYLSFLEQDTTSLSATESVLCIFDRLQQWMEQYAPNGCMSMNAIAAFPENEAIKDAVDKHKQQVKHYLGNVCQRPDLATQLFILHEGVSSVWPLLGADAFISTKITITTLLEH